MTAMGRVIGNKYRIMHQIGRGGMGEVWVADHVALHSRVAVKFLDAELAEREDARRRFRREARTAAALGGPHVVQVFDYGIDGRDPYLVMELLEGETLAAHLRREGRLAMSTVRQLVAQIASALGRAHEQGIVHRDLKPANVFLVNDDSAVHAKLLDFGLAKRLVFDTGSGDALTKPGQQLGTFHYMSPEQLKGLRVDARTDVWAFSVLVFETVTGRLPFVVDRGARLVSAICSQPTFTFSSLTDLPPRLDDWLRRGLCRNLNTREASIRALADSFIELTAGITGRCQVLTEGVSEAIPSLVAYASTDESTSKHRVASSIPAAINDRRDFNHIALIARINRETAVLWTRHRAVKGQMLKLTLHFENEEAGHSTVARVTSVTPQPADGPELWRFEIKVRFEAALEGLDTNLERLGLTRSSDDEPTKIIRN